MTEREPDELFDRLARANPVAPGATDGAVSWARAGATLDAIVSGIIRVPRRVALASLLSRWRHRRPAPTDELLDELLRAANPTGEQHDVLGAGAVDEVLFQRIVSAAGRNRSQSERRRLPRRLVITVAVGVALAASAFGYVLADRHVTNTTAVRCYEAASLHADYVGINLTHASAAESCRDQVWSRGGFGEPKRPPLVGCVLAQGIEGVFPGRSDSLCARLGLSVALSPTATAKKVAELRVDLDRVLDPASNCVAPRAAREIALQRLADLGLAGWSVRIGQGFSITQPCTEAFLVTSTDVIELDSFPRIVEHHPVGPTR